MKKIFKDIRDNEDQPDMSGKRSRSEFQRNLRGRISGCTPQLVSLLGFLFFLVALILIGKAFMWW